MAMDARRSWRHFRVAAAALMVLAGPSPAAEVSGYVTLTTDYVRRGVTQSDSDPAVQLGVDAGFANGIYAGVWGSTVDIENGPTRSRDTEVNYYLGYEHDTGKDWRVSANVVAYSYPGQTGNIDYDYVEYTLGAIFADTLWLQYSYSPELYLDGYDSHNYDLYAERALNTTWTIGGGGGYYDTSSLSGDGYWYAQLGATATLRYADIDIRVHDTSRPVPIISTPERADARLALTIRIPF